MNSKRNSILTSLIIGTCFLWTGSGYLTWMYRLLDFYESATVDLLTEVLGYVFQVVGLLLFAFFVKKKNPFFTSKKGFAITIIIDYVFILLSAFGWNSISTLAFGYVMNLFHGLIAGFYLTRLAVNVPQQKRGVCLGLGYGLGTFCSYLLSLIGKGNFLRSNVVLIVYAGFAILSTSLISQKDDRNYIAANDNENPMIPNHSAQFLLLAGITIFLLSGIKNVGFYFPLADLASGKISLEFTRVFYAFGLIIAGFINDKNRKYGAICCIAALVFTFMLLMLQENPDMSGFVWIMGYFFFGFFVVYRMILFADLAEKTPSFLYLSGLGLMWGRLGDIVGALVGILLSTHTMALVVVSSLTFAVTIFIFFIFYHKLYFPVVSVEENYEMLVTEFAGRYQFSAREQDVFRLIIDGRSNPEIAGDLYISENTVKFHIKNILKKAQCTNRTELIALFRKSSS